MSEKHEMLNDGQVKISDEVISIIASIAASEIEGVNSAASGFVDGISVFLPRKTTPKGIKVELKDNDAVIDMTITIDYSFNIRDVAEKVQNKVKREVENMTGLNVTKVNVIVQNVVIPKEEPQEEETEEEKED